MAEQTAPHQHIWKQARSHHAWNQCVCGMRPHSPEHARELEACLEKVEAERDTLKDGFGRAAVGLREIAIYLDETEAPARAAVKEDKRMALQGWHDLMGGTPATDAPSKEAAKEADRPDSDWDGFRQGG